MSAIAIASGGSALTLATGNLTFYVDSGTGSDSHDGLTSATAFATIQHAVSVALSFDYQSLYQCTIKVAAGTYAEYVTVAGGILYGKQSATTRASAFIVGDATTPTNVKISPTLGGGALDVGTISFQGGYWALDGFSLVGDPTNSEAAGLLAANHVSVLQLGTLDFNFNGGFFDHIIDLADHTYVQSYGQGAGTGNWTFHGTGSFNNDILITERWTRFRLGNNWTFNTAVNLVGAAFFHTDIFSYQDLSVITFTNAGNFTNGPPLVASNDSAFVFGADPTTLTLPGGTFDPSQTFVVTGLPVIDASSVIDGNFYALEKNGLPANTDIYKGSWRFFKDTSGGGVYAAYNDAGVIKKVALV